MGSNIAEGRGGFGAKKRAPDRGREDRLFTRSPLPPNRTCGSPASGFPVGSFTSKRIGTLNYGLLPARTTQGRKSTRLAISDDQHRDHVPVYGIAYVIYYASAF